MRVLSTEEEERLLDALKGNELVRGIITIALHTGLRRGEIFNLEWRDLDFDRETIEVRESKSGKKRLVPMNRSRCVYFEKNSWAFGHQDDGAVHACY